MKIWLPAIRAESGADVFTVRLADGLRRAGHEPILQWFPKKFELIPWALHKTRAPDGIDIVHAGCWQGFAFKRPGIPLVVTEHHYIRHPEFIRLRNVPQKIYHRMLVGRWLANSYAAANEIVAVSNNTADAMRQAIGRNVSTVHNWVDTEAFKPNESSLESKERSRFRILFVGNPSRWKGSDLIPEYAKRLGNSVEIWCLWGLRDKSVLSKLPRNVKSIPRVEMAKMPDLYRQVDSVIVPARYEAFGFVALEAMASGLPVVGFNTTGTAEVCVDGVTALLSNVDDVGSLVENTNRLIASSELRTSLGHAGRRRVVADFSEALAIERYLETYRRAIKNFNHR